MSQARQVLHKRYELLNKVGDGGMAVVYRARDLMLNRIVAVKMLREQYAADPNFLARFEREAQSAANLSHPNIVNVYDTGNDGDIHYIVMEFIDGQSLKEAITKEGPFDTSRAIDYTAQIASAIDYAHRQGLIHRDIKPQNILITQDDRIKVTDFGIAKGLSDASLTQTGVALGTVHYFSPEQARGEPARAESDLYSIAVVLYEMLTKRLPFEADTPVALALKHIEEPPPPPRRFNPNIPPMVEAIIMKALSKRVEQRYPTVGAFATALKNTENPQAAQQSGDLPTQISQRAPLYGQPQVNNDATVVAQNRYNSPQPQPDYGYQQRTPPPPTPRQNPYAPVYNTDPRQSYPQGGGYSGGYQIEPRPYPDQPVRRGGMGWGSFILLFLVFAVLAALVVFGVVFGLNQLGTASPTAIPIATATVQPTPTNTAAPKQVAVPDLGNKTLDEAKNLLKNAGLQIGAQGEDFSDTVDSGRVMAYSPQVGAKVNEGSKVNVTLSKGKEQIKLPGSYYNTTGTDAIKQLQDLGFKVSSKQEASTATPPVQAGAVIRTEPDIKAGTLLPKGSAIVVVVSSGIAPTTAPANPNSVQVPAVRNMPREQAQKILQDLGLKVTIQEVTRDQITENLRAFFDSQPVGNVVGQDPDENSAPIAKGSNVTLVVKKG